MQTYEWRSEYETGYGPIDDQHRILLGIANRILLSQGGDHQVIRGLLREILLFAKFHFASELNHMVVSSYPRRAEHEREHEALLTILREDIRKVLRREIAAGELVLFLAKWFVNHTNVIDKDLGQFLTARHREAQWSTARLARV